MGMAAPQGGVVTSGGATIGQAGGVTRIDQSTQRATIHWQGFGIGAGETVNFVQPNASAITLNRVVGNERSVIDGVLNANGKVFLINSNGVLFTRGSSVNTAGLVASTLDISDADFNAGRYVFNGNGGSGSVINMGTLTAAHGGYVALLGNSVSNQGVIVATKGTVALASGDRISLNFNGDSLVSVSIDQGTLNALVENKGAIYADGGQVILTAKAADDLLGSQVNNTGIVQARTLDDLKGSIVVRADGGTARVGGTLDASAPASGDGGTVETSGRSVRVSDDAAVTTRAASGTTGTWTLASDGFTVGAGANISGTQLGTQLGNNNVVITSTGGSGADGHVHVNQAVNWSANTALTLTAANDVRINAPITATGMSAGLNLNFGAEKDYRINKAQGASVTLSGANASLAMNGQAYTLIHRMSDLEAIDGAGRYALAGNLDASGKTYGNTVVSTLFGTLAGLGHTISNLTILEPLRNDGMQVPTALIGTAQVGSVIRDIGLVDVNVSGYARVGGLVGENFGGSISHAYVTGTVQGALNVGGLVGYNGSGFDLVSGAVYTGDGVIADSYSSAAVSGASRYNTGAFTNIGGLVGRNIGARYKILRSSASGNVSVFADPGSDVGSQNVGGLVGSNAHGTIADSHATGNVTVSDKIIWVGGLAGVSGGSAFALIANSYATGDVTGGQSAIGGLVGYHGDGGALIVDSYATGNVTSIKGTQDFGGLVGVNSGSTISGSHASGTVTVTGISAGGLVGNNGGSGASITNSYATGDVKGGAISAGVGGLAGANSGTISGSHASGNVWGSTSGGLVGGNQGVIKDSYASGNVFGSYAAGGLVGQTDGGTISNSRASGHVTGGAEYDFTGGLVGRNQNGDIDNSHVTGTVTHGSDSVGRLIGGGEGTGTVTNSTYRDAAAEAAAQAAAQAAAEAAARAAAAAQAAAQAAAEAAARASGEAAAQAAADAQAAAVAAAQATVRAATLQARADAGARLAAAATADAQRQPERPAVQMTAGLTQRAALLADHIVLADRRNFSTNIQRIEIDGKVFELEDEDDHKAAPAAQPSTPR